MSDITESFSMQGKVALGLRNPDGSRQPAKWVYDASLLEWDFTSDQAQQKESYSGNRGIGATMSTGKTMQVKLTLNQLNDDNAALAVNGQVVATVGGTVTAEPLAAGKAGEMLALEYAKVSELVLTGGAGGTTELVEDTDYTVNATTGVLTYLTDQATAVSADYAYAAHSLVTVLSQGTQDMYVLFDGMNTVDGATYLARGEVYRMSFGPAAALALINAEFGTLELTGDARVDPVRLGNSRYGGYARLLLLQADLGG